MRAIILVVVALGLAGGTAFLAKGWLTAQRSAIAHTQVDKQQQQPAKRVLVAKEDLAVGHFLRPEDMRWQAWPNETLAPTYLIEGQRKMEEFVGGVSRAGIAAGEPITERRVVKPGDRGFLAAVLDPGMRAVSVAVNATTGISGFVFPGDRVDVLLTHAVKDENGGGESVVRRATETVLINVRVIAVDQRTDDKNPEATVAKTATLEVSPKQAEVVSVVSEIGKLSLSLRSLRREGEDIAGVEAAGGVDRQPIEDPKAEMKRSLTYDTEVSRLIRPVVDKGKGQTVAVLRGPKSEDIQVK